MKPSLFHIDGKAVGNGTAACLLAFLSLARAESVPLPQAIPLDHYQPIWTRSPFTVASADDDGPKGTWALAGLTQDGDSPLVILLNRQTQERMTVTKEPNDKGFSVEAVDFNADLFQSSARIRTRAETLTVRFDQALAVVNNPAPPTAPSQPNAPGQPPRPPVPGTPPHSTITRTTLPHPIPKAKPPIP